MKIKVLSSGTLLHYEQVQVGKKGGARANFPGAHSAADMAEAKLFLESLKPETAKSIVKLQLEATGEEVKALMEHYLGGGNSN